MQVQLRHSLQALLGSYGRALESGEQQVRSSQPLLQLVCRRHAYARDAVLLFGWA